MKAVRILSLCLLAWLAVDAVAVFGQFRDAGAKIRGDAWSGGQARTYQSHARDYSRFLYYQAQCEEGLTPAQAQQYVGAIKQNISAANKALDKVQSANAKDEAVKKSIEKIKKIHEGVLAHCETIEGECQKPDGSAVTICDCCVDMTKELDEASAETDKLLKHLKADPLPEMRKSGDKKAAPKKEKR